MGAVVVGRLQHCAVLDQIDADHQAATGRQHIVQTLQKGCGLARGEVADARTGKNISGCSLEKSSGRFSSLEKSVQAACTSSHG